MKRERKAADYDIDAPVDMHAVTSCITNSKKIIKLVRGARALYDRQHDPKHA